MRTLISGQADACVGRRIREARRAAEMSLDDLAAAMRLSAQQVSKIERGQGRTHSAQLWACAQALGRPVGYFFETVPGALPAGGASREHLDFLTLASRLSPDALEALAMMTRALAGR